MHRARRRLPRERRERRAIELFVFSPVYSLKSACETNATRKGSGNGSTSRRQLELDRILLDGEAVHVDHAVLHDSRLLEGLVERLRRIANARKPVHFGFFQVFRELRVSTENGRYSLQHSRITLKRHLPQSGRRRKLYQSAHDDLSSTLLKRP